MDKEFIEIRDRLAQGDFKGFVVDRFDAEIGCWFFAGNNLIDVGDMALLEIAGVR